MGLERNRWWIAAGVTALLAGACDRGGSAGGDAGVDGAAPQIDAGAADDGGPGEDAGSAPDGGSPSDAGGVDGGEADGGSGPAPGWHHAFDMTGESGFGDVVELPSGDLVAVGAVSSFGAGEADGLVARFASDGTYLWSRAIGTAETDGVNAVVGDGAGGVVVVGHTEYPPTVPFVARFDAAGDLVFAEHLDAPRVDLFWDSNLTLTSVARMADGNFALVGHQEDDDRTMAGSGPFDGWIGIMDPTGALVRQRRFGSDTAYLAFYESAALPGGDLVVVGHWNEEALVMRLDSTLEMQWRATQGSDFRDYGVDLLAILPLPSGDLILGGRYFEADFSTTVSHWFLQRLTGAGVGVWSRRLEHDFSGVTGLFARSSTEFVALGYAPNGSDADAYAAVLDTDGFLLSQGSLGLTGTDWLSEGVVAADGSLVVAGYSGGTPYGSARLARIPSDVPACDPAAAPRLASVTYAAAGDPDTADFGADYTVTVSDSGPTAANGPSSRTPTVLCAP
jgi:hypothetical protein